MRVVGDIRNSESQTSHLHAITDDTIRPTTRHRGNILSCGRHRADQHGQPASGRGPSDPIVTQGPDRTACRA